MVGAPLHNCSTARPHNIKPASSIPESDLIAGLKARNPDTFEYLYDRYSKALFGVVTRIIANEAIAEETLHDAFLRIWERIDSYDPTKGRLFTWMLNLTRNLAIDRTRSREMRRAQKTGDLENIVNVPVRDTVTPQVDTIGLIDVLNKLPDDQKFVIEQLYLKGYTQAEVAEEFNIPLGTVKTRTRLAMTALRTILDAE